MREEALTSDESTLLEESMYVALAPEVAKLLSQMAVWRRYFEGGEGVRVWCVSSTSRGGGVAEMMPRLLMQLRGFGVEAHWLILEAPASEHGATFFTFTKQLHNAIHGVAGLAEAGTPEGDAARSRYMAVCTSEADALADRLAPIFAPSRDLVLLHDPQPLGMLPRLRERLPGVKVVWRVHVGLDSPAACAASAWACLEPLAALADACVWSCHAYVREALRAKSLIIRPGISPLSEKNRELTPAEVLSVLARAGLLHHLTSPRCALDEPFVATAVCYDASTPAVPAAGIGGGGGADGCGRVCPTCPPASTACLLRPIVLQVSRWDKLKGFAPLLAAWVELKSGAWPAPATASAAQRAHYERLLETSVLVLAGPEPASICDDPEGKQVLEQLQRHIDALPPALRGDVKLALLPMADAQENALIVNALQRSATIVVQCSLQEGFGLTVTEALFKRVCVVGTQAVGLREQIRDRIDGLLVAGDPAVPANVARALQTVLLDSRLRAFLAVNGQRRVYDEGLLDMCQLGQWMRLAARLFNWRAASRPLAPELKAFVRFAELATPVLPGGPADELVSGEEGGPDAADEGEAAPEVATAATATDAAADDLAAAAAAAAAELPERSPSFRLLLHRLAADHRARRILARHGGASRRAA